MPTIIEKDSPVVPLIVLGVVFLLFLCGAIGLAYIGGVFTGKNAVMENDARITREHLSHSPPSPAPKPSAP